MKTAKQPGGVQIRLTKPKRVSLRCPLAVDRTDLEYNYDTSALQVRMTVSNMGGGGLTSDTVESMIVVIRLFGANREQIPCAENEYYAKSLRFGEEGLASGEEITFRVTPDCPMGETVRDLELYISRVRYTDGASADFMRGDFFDLTGEGVLLTKKFKKNHPDVMEQLGEGAVYLPQHMTEIVWRCTCGEFSESDTCPACGRSKNALFAAVDPLVAPVEEKQPAAPLASPDSADSPAPANAPSSANVPVMANGFSADDSSAADGKTAEYAIGPQIAAAKANLEAGNSAGTRQPSPQPFAPSSETQKKKQLKAILLASISAASVILLLLVLLLIMNLCGKKEQGVTTTTQAPVVTQPDPVTLAEQIVRAYLDAHDYENALGYALASELDESFLQEIYSKAITYYTDQGNLERALDFANRQGDTQAINQILMAMFEEKLSDEDYIGAMEIASTLPEEQREEAKLRAADGYVASLVKAEEYRRAMEAAELYNTTTTPQQIAETAVNSYLSQNDYANAYAFALEFEMNDRIPEIAKKAVTYYMEAQELSNAMKYLAIANDDDVTKSVYEQLTDAQIRRYLPTFYGYLDFVKKQAVHASPISAQPQAMVTLDQMGNVFLGEEMIYDASVLRRQAVSVSACDTAVVVLLSDGTLQVLGSENPYYNQEDVAKWKGVVAISAGNYHLLALTKDGKVLAAGSNSDGQCATSSIEDAIAVSAGGHHSLILLADGTVTALGQNVNHICDTDDWTDMVAISAGALHSIGIKSDGTAVALGNCDVSGWQNVMAVVSGGSSAVGITAEHKLYYTVSGQSSTSLIGYENVVWVSVRQNSVAILTADGTLSGIGVVGYPPSGIPLSTDVFGMN